MAKFKINFEKVFPPRQFTHSNPIADILQKDERKFLIKLRTKEAKPVYDRFDNDFGLYLSKLPNNPVKEYVGRLYNERMFFIGTSKTGEISSYSRLLITKENRLAGVALNAYQLNIDVDDGSTSDIDECIYATYSAVVRAGALINEKEIKKDRDLQKLLATFIFLLFLKLLGKSMTVSSKQKYFLQAVCTYLFYRHYIGEKHGYALSILEKEFVGEYIPVEIYNEIKSKMDSLKPFDSMKDLPKVISDFNIADINPSVFLMQTLKSIKQSGFYALIGPLDTLISEVVLAQYPTELVSKTMMTNPDVHRGIEEIMNKYMAKIKFDNSAIPADVSKYND